MNLSIIIPVYNVEQTLQRCVKSVLEQSFTNYEIILIDDGSTDKSGQMIDSLAETDNRCTAIHQPNRGLSAARNTGIEIATGNYITFIDSDDFIAPETLTPLMNILETRKGIDLLEYPVLEHHGSPKEKLLNFPEATYTDMSAYWLKAQTYRHAYAWNKIYRRQLFNNIRYPEGRVFEDIFTLPQLLNDTRMVVTTNKGLYYYTHNPNGITQTATGKELTQLLDSHLRYLNQWPNIDSDYYAMLLNIQLDVYNATKASPRLPRMPFFSTPKLILLQLLGIKRLCQINHFTHARLKRNPS